MDSNTISYLKGTIAAFQLKDFKAAHEAVSTAIGKRLSLNIEWYLEYSKKKRAFMIVNNEDSEKCFPVCPIQTPLPCPYYAAAGIRCPTHQAADLESVETASIESNNSRASAHYNIREIITPEKACKVIHDLYIKMQKNYKVKGNINNALIQKQVFDSLKESTSKTYHSKSLEYNVVLVHGDGEKEKEKEKEKKKKKGMEMFHTIGSLLIVDDESCNAFYTCREAGCFNVGTEIFKLEYSCKAHTHDLAPMPTTRKVHDWLRLGIDLLIITIFSNGDGMLTRPSNDTWTKLLFYIFKLGRIGVKVPMAGAHIKIWIGADRRTLNYARNEDPTYVRRQCIYPYCMRQAPPGDSILCGECAPKNDWTNPMAVFKKEAYGLTTSTLDPASELWIHELNKLR